MSDWEVRDFSFDSWISDLETVVDSIGFERFSLLGVSQGGPVSIAYASRHPERVDHLILDGAYARGWAKRGLSEEELEEMRAFMTIMRSGWGRDNPSARRAFTARFIPDANLEQMHWFDDLQRVSTSPENAVRFMNEFGKIDVSDLAAKISVPTLVLHARNDVVVPFSLGKELAALIPNARFVPLEGRDHIMLESDELWRRFLHEVRNFLEVPVPQDEHLATQRDLGISGWLKGSKRPQK